MEYYFNNIDPISFQRLVNAILVRRFGEDLRVMPLRGADGGRDAETASGNPFLEFVKSEDKNEQPWMGASIRPGRYLFQAKHHKTIDGPLSATRGMVVTDFGKELRKNVLAGRIKEQANFFILVTNVPASKQAIDKIDAKRRRLLKGVTDLHADVWWEDQVVALLDQMPELWAAFPSLFAGGQVPILSGATNKHDDRLSRIVRLAVGNQYEKDLVLRFKQIDQASALTALFVDLDVEGGHESRFEEHEEGELTISQPPVPRTPPGIRRPSVLSIVLSDRKGDSRILFEGGPGQGKSTATQMVAQIHRYAILNAVPLGPENRWRPPRKLRIPLRIELRTFADWVAKYTTGSVDEFLATALTQQAGGAQVTVEDVHQILLSSPALLIFDGLDEVGNDDLRDVVVDKIIECLDRVERYLNADIRALLTTRPPALAGRRDRLTDFRRFLIAPLSDARIDEFLARWTRVNCPDLDEANAVEKSFNMRRQEPHVQALARNPMQLSVLLHFIRLKGEAFPDRRAELYRDYFKTVIDRDVEKSPTLRLNRVVVEQLHQLLGFQIHALTEAERADGTVTRLQLLDIVREWLSAQNDKSIDAEAMFKLGEERLGLIVALRGEGEDARYGYEVQPIREYFAAAFLNEQIAGNAHDVFESLLRRSFWREVALFLAGLRRANEKADLILRAQAVDQDEILGWRQDGRSIIIQLMLEGVFSDFKHVYSDGLNYVSALIDPDAAVGKHEPKNYIENISALMKQGDPAHIAWARAALSKVLESRDLHTVFRSYLVARNVLALKDYYALTLRYSAGSGDLVSRVRLTWPSLWGVKISDLAKHNKRYWEPERSMAAAWWEACVDNEEITRLGVPTGLHKLLVERFAFLPSLPSPYFHDTVGSRSRFRPWHPHSPLAIWWLLANLRNMWLSIETGAAPPPARKYSIDYDGLSAPVRQAVGELIGCTDAVLRDVSAETESGAFSEFLSVALKLMGKPGLPAWIASRCVSEVVMWGSRMHVHHLRHLARRYEIVAGWYRVSDWAIVLRRLAQFYELPYRSTHWGQVAQRIIAVGGLSPNLVVSGTKRLKHRSPMCLLSRKEDWLSCAPISFSSIPDWVQRHRRQVPELLRWLATADVKPGRPFKKLGAAHVQKIVKIVRHTNDPAILCGALTALLYSRFERIAGQQITLKMLRGDTLVANRGPLLFGIAASSYAGEANAKQFWIGIAKAVLESNEAYSHGLASAAAAYIFDHEALNIGPLITESQRLRLYVRRPSGDES